MTSKPGRKLKVVNFRNDTQPTYCLLLALGDYRW